MMVLFALLLPTILGFLIVSLILSMAGDRETSFLERLCLSYPLGAGLLTLQMFILGLLRVPFTLASTSAPLVIEIAALTIWSLRKKISFMPSTSLGLVKDISSHETPVWKKTALILLVIWVGTKMASVFVETGLRLITAEDAWVNWTVGAKLFYYTRGLMLDVPTVDFFTRGAVNRIVTYPLHNPLLQTWTSLWNGSFDEVLVKFWCPVYYVTASVYLYTIAARELGRLSGMTLVIMFMCSPLMSYHGTEPYSDLAVGVYLFFASASFLHAMRGRKGSWVLMGIFSAQALLTKEEALFFVLPLLVSALAYTRSAVERPSRKQTHLVSILLPFLMVIPWYAFKIYYGLGLGAGEAVSMRLTFHADAMPQVLLSIISLENFNVFLVFFPVLLLFGWRRSKEIQHLLFAFTCYALFFAILYLFTGYYIFINQGTIVYRNILTVYPVLCMLTALLLKEMSPMTAEAHHIAKKKLI